MKRLLLILLAAVLLAGCRSRAPLTDPFVGPTCIEPPGTRAGMPPATDPYYGTGMPGMPGMTAPGAAVGPATSTVIPMSPGVGTLRVSPRPLSGGAMPSGGTSYQSGILPQAGAALPPAASQAQLAAVPRPGTQRYVSTLQPRSPAAAPAAQTATAPAQPGTSKPAARAVDIRSLPDAKKSSALEPRRLPDAGEAIRLVAKDEAKRDPAVRQASASEPFLEDEGAAASPAKSTVSGTYAYEADYSRLRGRLEFHQIDQQWRLRYIPVDGETDDFGGSVVIADPSVLSGYERGEFVEIRGKLGERGSGDLSYAPKYHVSELKRVSP